MTNDFSPTIEKGSRGGYIVYTTRDTSCRWCGLDFKGMAGITRDSHTQQCFTQWRKGVRVQKDEQQIPNSEIVEKKIAVEEITKTEKKPSSITLQEQLAKIRTKYRGE